MTKPTKWITQMVIAGNQLSGETGAFVKTLRAAIESGEMTLSGSEDWATFVANGLTRVQRAVDLFEAIKADGGELVNQQNISVRRALVKAAP
jgi:hypothetical protein